MARHSRLGLHQHLTKTGPGDDFFYQNIAGDGLDHSQGGHRNQGWVGDRLASNIVLTSYDVPFDMT